MTTATRDIILPAEWRDFWALTKPRVMSLVVFTALCGLLAAPGSIHPVIGFTAILCLALGAGACGALNQCFEADIDAKMARTAGRPLPAGRMDRASALNFGIGLAAFSVGIMGVAVNWLCAGSYRSGWSRGAKGRGHCRSKSSGGRCCRRSSPAGRPRCKARGWKDSTVSREKRWKISGKIAHRESHQ